MGIEIERKFLVKDTKILMNEPHSSYVICQYYIDKNTRLRFVTHSDGSEKAYITMKYKKRVKVREEWEFEIDNHQALRFCSNLKFQKIGLGYIKKQDILYTFPQQQNGK